MPPARALAVAARDRRPWASRTSLAFLGRWFFSPAGIYRRGMTRVPPTMMKPTGWFQIGWSIDFPLGPIAAKHHFGEEVVVFRTDDGRLRALDAYCGHMGAHLGHGGELCGDRVVCPFHGWEWNGDGRNVSIPYQDRPN